MKISVNKNHIDDAIRGAADACMVHDAAVLSLDLPENVEVKVHYGSMAFFKRGPKGGLGRKAALRVRIPGKIGQIIREWDEGVNPKPFEFDLDLPDDWRKQIS